MPNPNFWNNPSFEPKRQFRFMVQLDLQGQDVSFLAKTVDKPSYTIGSTPHQFFNHTFYYPGRVEWNTITLTLVDPVTPNASGLLYEYLENSGIQKPNSFNQATSTTITKATAIGAKSDILIQEVATSPGSSQSKVFGEWKLINAFFTEVNFGSHDYGSEDMVEVSVTVQYDWAEYNKISDGAPLSP